MKLLGKIIDEHGSYDCNQLIIADNQETWLFAQLSGHQWIALNLTATKADMASVNPNIGRLKYRVDLSDENGCLHSEKLESTAVDAGSAVYFDDGSLDVASSYGKAEPGTGQYTRFAQGRAYFGAPLAEGSYALGERGVTAVSDPELFFSPNGKTGLFDVLRSFAARGEQTADLNANENPNLYAVGNNRTVETHLFQIRRGMSADIATIQWEALSRAEFSVFVPSYSALLTEVDPVLYPAIDSWDESHTGARENVDDVTSAMDAASDNGSLDYVLMDINTLAYNNRAALAAPVRAYLDSLQRQLIAQQAVVDEVMQQTPEAERAQLANELHKQASAETYRKTATLLDEMRAYLNTDQSLPFVPSDYDAESGLSKTPMFYATSVFAPEFSSEPSDVKVVKGEGCKLEARATIKDGVQGSDANVIYEWFEQKDPSAAAPARTVSMRLLGNRTGLRRPAPTTALVSVGTGESFSPDTSAVGTRSYLCVATNIVSGMKTTSRLAAVTVAESEQQSTDAGGQSGNDVRNEGRRRAKLPQTADPFVPGTLISLGLVGTGLISAAAASRKMTGGDRD